MAPLGLGAGFYSLGPTLSAGEAVHVGQVDGSYMVVPTGANALDLGANFQSTIRGSFTFATYFYGSAVTNTKGSAYLLSALGDATNNDYLKLGINADGKTEIGFKANNDPFVQFSASDEFLGARATGWRHIAFVITKNSSADTTAVVYVDGTAVTLASAYGGQTMTDTNHGGYDGHGSTDALLGNFPNATGNNRALLMKHSAIWSSALDAANIVEIHGAGISTPLDLTSASGNYDTQGDLVGYWKLTEGSGTTATDTTGNSNGTIVGTASLI